MRAASVRSSGILPPPPPPPPPPRRSSWEEEEDEGDHGVRRHPDFSSGRRRPTALPRDNNNNSNDHHDDNTNNHSGGGDGGGVDGTIGPGPSNNNINFYSSYQYTEESMQRRFGMSPSSSSPTPWIHPNLVMFDLLRLVRHMERQSQEHNGEAADDDHKVYRERVDHLENLWRQLDESHRTRQLRDRVDAVLHRGRPKTDIQQQQQQQHGVGDDNDNNDDDLVHRIFLSKRRATSVDVSGTAGTKGGGRRGGGGGGGGATSPARSGRRPDPGSDNKRGGDTSMPDVPDGGGDDDDDETGGAAGANKVRHDPPLGPKEGGRQPPAVAAAAAAAAPSVQQLQEDQRQQMGAAIAMMAAQLKRQTEAIHHTLQTQNAHLGTIEDIAETNVDKVDRLAKDVTQHVRKGWTRTFTTWMVIIMVAVAFVASCLLILMVPKRPGACLLFCPKQPPATTDSAQLVCHDNADGTQECVTIQEAFSRLYSHQQEKQPEQAELMQDVQHAEASGADIDVAVDGGDDNFHECQWDGTGGASARSSGDCAQESTIVVESDAAKELPEQDPVRVEAREEKDAIRTDTVVAANGPGGAGLAEDGTDNSEFQVDASPGHSPIGTPTPNKEDSPVYDATPQHAATAGKGSEKEAYEDSAEFDVEAQHDEKDGDEDDFDDGGGDDYDPEDDEETSSAEGDDSPDEDENQKDSDWVRDSEDDWQQVDEGAAPDDGREDDDDWDLPPIPDADDVLREYMENNHHAESSGLIDGVFEGEQEEIALPGEHTSEHDEGDNRIQEDHVVDLNGDKEGDGGGPNEVLPIEPTTGGVAVYDGEPFTPQNVRNAAATGDVRLLEGYLRAKPDWVNDSDRNRWTGLHLATRAGHMEAVRLLLEYRADRSLQTVAGDTPHRIASQRLGSDHPVTLLLQSDVYPVEKSSTDRHDEL